MSDDPPKTLSSRSQTLSKLQPVEPPRERPYMERPTYPRVAAGARDPRGGRMTAFPIPFREEQPVQNCSIGTLAGRAQARYPLASVQCTKSARCRDLSGAFQGTSTGPSHSCRLRFSSPISRRTPERFCACAPASTWRPILSSRRVFRCRTVTSAGRAWITSIRFPSPATTPGRNSSNGADKTGHRLVLFSTKGADSYLDYRYKPADILLFGRESAGVTDDVVTAADARLVIPIKPGLRSLNVAVAAGHGIGRGAAADAPAEA